MVVVSKLNQPPIQEYIFPPVCKYLLLMNYQELLLLKVILEKIDDSKKEDKYWS